MASTILSLVESNAPHQSETKVCLLHSTTIDIPCPWFRLSEYNFFTVVYIYFTPFIYVSILSRNVQPKPTPTLITYTRVVPHLARMDTPNITLVVSRVARSDTPNRGDAMSTLHAQPASPIKYNGLTHTVLSSNWPYAYSYIQQMGRKIETMNAKNTKKITDS